MIYRKIIDDLMSQPSKFRKKVGLKQMMNHEEFMIMIMMIIIMIIITSNLCDYGGAS